MILRYDHPDATSMKSAIFRAYTKGGMSEALSVATKRKVKIGTTRTWVYEFRKREGLSRPRRKNAERTTGLQAMQFAFKKGGPDMAIKTGRAMKMSPMTIKAYLSRIRRRF